MCDVSKSTGVARFVRLTPDEWFPAGDHGKLRLIVNTVSAPYKLLGLRGFHNAIRGNLWNSGKSLEFSIFTMHDERWGGELDGIQGGD